MSEEKKNDEKCCDTTSKCCDSKSYCCCYGGRGKFVCGFLLALLLASAGLGLYKAGKCAGMHCASQAPATAPAAPAPQK